MLKFIANILKSNVRSTDSVFRWGGEEFIVVIQSVTQPSLQELADKLRAIVQQSILDRGLHCVAVTISIGATLVQDDDTLDSLVARADQLMYQSKAAGRNCVTFG